MNAFLSPALLVMLLGVAASAAAQNATPLGAAAVDPASTAPQAAAGPAGAGDSADPAEPSRPGEPSGSGDTAQADCPDGRDCSVEITADCPPGEDCEPRCPEGDTCEERTGSWIVVPIVRYAPETDFAFGLGYLHSFFMGDPSDTTLSASRLAAQYSLNKQLEVRWVPRLYFPNDMLRLRLALVFSDFPNSYWGVGPDTRESDEELYTRRSWFGRVDLERRVAEHLYVGGIYEVESFDIVERESAGLLATSAPGRQGGLVSGLGLSFARDTRDNLYATYHGQYQYVSVTSFGTWLGSDFAYTRVEGESRHFLELGEHHVLAGQALVDLNFGGPPLERLALLGGPEMLRGYREGRFRDNHLVAVQGEYRTPFLWRFGLVAFVAAGWVFGDVGDLALDTTKVAGGAGVRFAFDPAERINLRFDVGIGPGTTGFYLSFGEAF